MPRGLNDASGPTKASRPNDASGPTKASGPNDTSGPNKASGQRRGPTTKMGIVGRLSSTIITGLKITKSLPCDNSALASVSSMIKQKSKMTTVLIRRNAPTDSCHNLTALMPRWTKTSFIITPHYICAHRNSGIGGRAPYCGLTSYH